MAGPSSRRRTFDDRPARDRAHPSPVGVIGAGRMGSGLCARLVQRGFAVLATDIRSQARVAVERIGVRWVDTPGELADQCDRVLTVLPGAAEVEAVRPALLAAMQPGSTWVDLSTSTPAAARANAEHGRAAGVRVLDAPMGGGPAEARAGGLTLFVGGAAADLASQRDLTDALAAQVLHVGDVGSGCLVKLLANLLWFGQALAGAEVLALAARAGLAPEDVRDALSRSAGASRFMEQEAHALLAGDDLESFSLAGCVQELHAITELGRDLGVPLGMGERVTRLYDEALEHYGAIDGELLAARLVAHRAGVAFPQRPNS